MSVKLKFWFFQHYLPVILLLVIILSAILIIFWDQINDFELLLTILGGIVSFIFIIQKQQLDEIKTFKELFNDFNKRYDRLNSSLNEIAENGLGENEERKKNLYKLYDYFNLCGEEYLYYTKGYIFPNVWKAWCNGILYYLEHAPIKEIWDGENPASYYGLTYQKIRDYSGSKN